MSAASVHIEPADPPVLGAGSGLYVHRESAVHALPAHPKLLAAVTLVAVFVATPITLWQAFAGYLALVLALVRTARLPARTVLRRMVVEVPFLVFALALPLVATGERVEVLGLPLSSAGLVGAANILAKATLGVLVGIVLASTTTPRALLGGLDRLHLPAPLVAIASFMVRYASVVAGDLARMRIARRSRGFTGGRLADLRFEAAGAGTLFVRSYERGERVHRAMLARGYTGRMPSLGTAPASAREWCWPGRSP